MCWCAPFGHFAWLDDNGVAYDIEGVSTAECQYYIPEIYIKEGLADFKHVPDVSFNASEEYIQEAIMRYKRDCLAEKELVQWVKKFRPNTSDREAEKIAKEIVQTID